MVCQLKEKLHQLENTLCRLLTMCSVLEQDIAVKEKTLQQTRCFAWACVRRCRWIQNRTDPRPPAGPVPAADTLQLRWFTQKRSISVTSFIHVALTSMDCLPILLSLSVLLRLFSTFYLVPCSRLTRLRSGFERMLK